MIALLLAVLPQHGRVVPEPYAPKVAEASAEGARALEAVRVPAGWSAELWAAEPLLANPVVFSIDDRGEVYVCETFRLHRGVTDMRDHMGWLDDELACTTVADRRAMFEKHLSPEEVADWSTEHERVRLLRDTDGDGKADTATVFADGFHDLMDGIAAGVLNVDGDVFYTCMPHLWRLRDTDGDGVSDERESVAHGFGVHVALLGHDLHGLVVGPDRRLYFSCGDRGLNLSSGSGEGIALPHEGAVLRCELDGSGMEVVHRGLRNPQELVFDVWGDLFTGDNNSDGGDQARWVNVVPGGDSGWRHHYQYVTEPVLRGPWNDELQWKPPGENRAAWLVPPIANLGAGPSGLDFAPGTGHPPELDGRFLMCDFRGDAKWSGVWAFRLERKGAFYELVDEREWLWHTLVTDVQFGPDGYLYWSDWVAGWGLTGKGRVYRMRFEGADAELVEQTRQLLERDLATLPTAQLEGLLAHPDRRVRQKAHFALADAPDGPAVLARVAKGGPTLFARLHAIWGLWVAGKQDSSVAAGLVALLGDEEGDVRSNAARVLGDLRIAEAAKALVLALDDEDARVRFQAAIACGRLRVEGAVPGLERMLLHADATNDPNLRHAAVQGLAGAQREDQLWRAASYTQVKPSEVDGVALGRVLALRALRSPRVADLLHGAATTPRVARAVAAAVHELGDPDALHVLSVWPWPAEFEAGVTDSDGDVEVMTPEYLRERVVAEERLAALMSDPGFLRRVLAACLSSPTPSLRRAERLLQIARWPVPDEVRVDALRLFSSLEDPSPRDFVSGRWNPIAVDEDFDLGQLLPEVAPEDPAALDAFPGDSKEAQLAWVDVLERCARGEAGSERVSACLEHFFGDVTRHGAVRARALDALVAKHPERAGDAVDRALADEDPVLRAAALEALGGLEPKAALARLAGVLAAGSLPERRAAYRVLRGLTGEEADALVADELLRLNAGLVSPELALEVVLAAEGREAPLVASLLEAHGAAAKALDPAVAPYVDALAGGDAARGKKLYESTTLSCLRCHSVAGDWSAQIGPSLHDVAARLPRLELVASIVDPNRRIAGGFETEMFFPVGDEPPVVGRVHLETDTSVQVIDADGELHVLELADVEVRRKDLSAMPNGLADQLTREQMRDLLAYLATLDGGAR